VLRRVAVLQSRVRRGALNGGDRGRAAVRVLEDTCENDVSMGIERFFLTVAERAPDD
jgi:hypothetical protein